MSTITDKNKTTPTNSNPDDFESSLDVKSVYQGFHDILLTFNQGVIKACYESKKEKGTYWVRFSWLGGNAMVKSKKSYVAGVFKRMVCPAEIQMDQSYKPTEILSVEY